MVYTTGQPNGATDVLSILHDGNFTTCITSHLDKSTPMAVEDCVSWVESPFFPLKSLADATVELFQTGGLPQIKNIKDGEIQATLDRIHQMIDDKHTKKRLIFVSGVPGAGKTLVGLKTVYDYANADTVHPIYLSGNDPLVNILQCMLSVNVGTMEGKSFIGTMKTFKRYGYEGAPPPHQNLLVFDEAQRAWDTDKTDPTLTEPMLLAQIGDKIVEAGKQVTLLCLMGEGQVIGRGEESGRKIWQDAFQNRDDWEIFVPPAYRTFFLPSVHHHVMDALHLDVSIRNDFIDVSPWVEAILSLDLEAAHSAYKNMIAQGFRCCLITNYHQVQQIFAHLKAKYPEAHTGLLMSSHGKARATDFGGQSISSYVKAENAYLWYQSNGSQGTIAGSEYLVQGIELEYPIVCFIGDYYIKNGMWTIDPYAKNTNFQDHSAILQNVYRVLLTRSRKGMTIYLPETNPKLQETVAWFRSMLHVL